MTASTLNVSVFRYVSDHSDGVVGLPLLVFFTSHFTLRLPSSSICLILQFALLLDLLAFQSHVSFQFLP